MKTTFTAAATGAFLAVFGVFSASAQYIDEQFNYSDGQLGSPWGITYGGTGTQGDSLIDVGAASTFLDYTPDGKQVTVVRSSTSTGGAPNFTLSTGTTSPVTSPWTVTQGDNVQLTFDMYVGSFVSGNAAQFGLRGGSTGTATLFSVRAYGTSASAGKFQVQTTGSATSYTDLLESSNPVTVAEDTWYRINYSSTIGVTTSSGATGTQTYDLTIQQLGTGGSTVYSGTGLTLEPTAPIGGTGIFAGSTNGVISYSVADVNLIPEPSTVGLALSGLLLLGWMRRSRKTRQASV
jgi:hypothetical protein